MANEQVKALEKRLGNLKVAMAASSDDQVIKEKIKILGHGSLMRVATHSVA